MHAPFAPRHARRLAGRHAPAGTASCGAEHLEHLEHGLEVWSTTTTVTNALVAAVPMERRRYSVALQPGEMADFLQVVDAPVPASAARSPCHRLLLMLH